MDCHCSLCACIVNYHYVAVKQRLSVGGIYMQRKGVSYDVGRVMGINWRPDFDPKIVQRELEIIKNDLHCNAVRICALELERLMVAAEHALQQGLEVWLSSELWDKSPEQTLDYIVQAAAAAERLRTRWPDQLVFSVGSELTLFMQGIVAGKTFMQRLNNPSFWAAVKAGKHNEPLRAFLAKANEGVRRVFRGKVTYAALIWEQVDWSLFDFVGVDHYWDERIQDRYVEMLKPLFAFGKPVVVTEFGFRTYQGAEKAGATGLGNVDNKTLFLHSLPIVGRFIRPRLRQVYARDEGLQAHWLAYQLRLLDSAGVDGGFIMTFVAPIYPYDENPRYDLDRDNFSLVKTLAGGRHGATYPDMTWEPKAAFKLVADYYGA